MNRFTHHDRLPRRIKSALAPERRFAADAKHRYLALYDAAHGLPAPHGSGWRAAWRSAAAMAAILGIVAGTSAFADVRNVPPTNMLYPLKRLAENVQLAVTPAAAKPTLELSFAARRAEEINAIASNPDAAAYAPLVRNLTKNLDAEVSSSLADEARTPLKGEALLKFCNSVAPASEGAYATTTPASTSSVSLPVPGEGGGRDGKMSVGERVAAEHGLFARAASDCPSVISGGAPTSTGGDPGQNGTETGPASGPFAPSSAFRGFGGGQGEGSSFHGHASGDSFQASSSGNASSSTPQIFVGDAPSGISGNPYGEKDGGDGGRSQFPGSFGR